MVSGLRPTAARNYTLALKAKAIVEVVRPHNVAVTFVTTLAGFSLAYKLAGYGDLVSAVLDPLYWLAASVVALIAAGGYAVNDYFDVDIDRVDKPWRPIPSGRVSAKTVYTLSVILMGLGILLSSLIGVLAFAYAGLTAVLLHEYSRWIKRRGLPGNLAVAFSSASTILYGGLAVAEKAGRLDLLLPVSLPAAYAFLLVLGREFVKSIEDYRGDLAGGARTLAVQLGPRKAAIVSSVVLAAVAAISPLPVLMKWYGICYIVFAGLVDLLIALSIHVLLKSHEPVTAAARARRMLKVAFAFGGLAFTLGLAC